MKKYSIMAKPDHTSKKIEADIKDSLFKSELIFDDDNPELVIVIGGDGTFLRAVHKYINKISSIHFIGIHTGTLGFFTSYSSSEVDKFLFDLLNRKPKVEKKKLLEINIDNQKEKLYAVNGARIENIIQTQIMDVYINEEHLETFRGTGLCVSTQAGSTAYNRSLRGAVIHSNLELLQLTEITGIHHKKFQSLQVPLILNSDTSILLTSKNFTNAVLCYDNLHLPLTENVKEVRCYLSDKVLNFLQYEEEDYIKRIRNLF